MGCWGGVSKGRRLWFGGGEGKQKGAAGGGFALRMSSQWGLGVGEGFVVVVSGGLVVGFDFEVFFPVNFMRI